jgi:hypothetical protein
MCDWLTTLWTTSGDKNPTSRLVKGFVTVWTNETKLVTEPIKIQQTSHYAYAKQDYQYNHINF